MKVVEVRREWCDFLASYVLRGYRLNEFIRQFDNEMEAKEWLKSMEEHYKEFGEKKNS